MSDGNVRVRFAPSPTGYFHVGGARTALFNWLFARQHGGQVILRIEDTDRTRYEAESLPDLLDSLRWLGLNWDEGPEVGGAYGPYFQSDRLPLYHQYAQELIDKGAAYRCYCTPERLTALREEQKTAGAALGYDRHCRNLTQAQIADYEAQGIRPVVRMAVPLEGATTFEDLLRGAITVENQSLKDLVLLKSDGFPTYHLANVVDDHLMAISHITRGEEWLSSAPNYPLLYKALGWQEPIQVHYPTILDPSGKGKLSKRKKKTADGREQLTYVHEFRQAGYLPEALFNFLALLGWSADGETEFFRRDELVRLFSLERISTSPAAFSYEKLEYMNASTIRSLGDNDLAGRLLRVLLAQGFDADFTTVLRLVPLVKERLKTLNDVTEWVDFCFRPVADYDPQMLIQKKMDRESTLAALQAARTLLSELPEYSEETIEAAMRTQAAELGLKLGPYLGGIRVAVSGKKVAPPLFGVLSILGRETAVLRLERAIAALSQSD